LWVWVSGGFENQSPNPLHMPGLALQGIITRGRNEGLKKKKKENPIFYFGRILPLQSSSHGGTETERSPRPLACFPSVGHNQTAILQTPEARRGSVPLGSGPSAVVVTWEGNGLKAGSSPEPRSAWSFRRGGPTPSSGLLGTATWTL
jgi:hypothetical protein